VDEEHCPRAAFFAYFFWLQQKSKLNEGIRLKKAWMPCAQRIKGVATNKKTSQSSFSSNPKESLKPFQKKEINPLYNYPNLGSYTSNS
jgi:hypothetical protein